MNKRRDILRGLITLPLLGAATGELIARPSDDKDFDRDYFKELGVRTFINAAGTYTALTASLPHPEVVHAINYAALQFVKLEELQDKVGERLAEQRSRSLRGGDAGCPAGHRPVGRNRGTGLGDGRARRGGSAQRTQ